MLEKYLGGQVMIAPGEGELHTRRFDWDRTLQLLGTAEAGTFIYQPTLRLPRRFYEQYGLDPELAAEAMTLLFPFQGPDLMVADQHPDAEAPFPVVVLLDALGHVLALPVEVSYTLPEALAALGSKFKYRRNDYYHFPLGHGMRAEAIHAAWNRGKPELLPGDREASGHASAGRVVVAASDPGEGPAGDLRVDCQVLTARPIAVRRPAAVAAGVLRPV